MNLWIYGDSYADDLGLSWQWTRQLADRWQCPVKFYSVEGTALSYTANQVRITADQWQPGDRVIIALTHPLRTWFIVNNPNISGPHLVNLAQLCDDIDPSGVLTNGMELYHRHLQHSDLRLIEQTSFYSYFADRADRQRAEIMCLQGFPPGEKDREVVEYHRSRLKIPLGQLLDISRSEVDPDPELTHWFFSRDPRANHLTRHSHDLLAEFIDRNWCDPHCDLSELYQSEPMITMSALKDVKFVKSQLIPERMVILNKMKTTSAPPLRSLFDKYSR